MASSLHRLRASIAAFLTWWLGELASMAAPLSRALKKRKQALTLNASETSWSLRLKKGSRVQELGNVSCQSLLLPNEPTTLASLAKRARRGRGEFRIVLPPESGLRKVLEMPPLAEADLRQALAFEIDRRTPFKLDEVYYDYRVIGRSAQTKKLSVELTTVPRATVDAMLQQVGAWGMRASAVDIAGDAEDGLGMNLLRAHGGDAASGQWTRRTVAIVALFVMLLGAAVYVPVSQLADLDDQLLAQVQAEKDKAKQTLALKDKLDQAIKAKSFLDERKRAVPGTLRVLDELSKAIPDNTWLSSLSEDKSQVKISGFSASAAGLIPILVSVPIFKNPTFASPIVQNPQKKLELFDILVDVKADDVKTADKSDAGSRP